MRKLATIRKIDAVLEHPNADRLGIYVVDGWKVIDMKDRYQVGDIVIYCEIDSFLPIREEFEFLRKSSFKRMGEQEGFRLRTIRLRGELSQGLLISKEVLPKDFVWIKLGEEVTEVLGIKKYERPIPVSLSGVVKGDFPFFIRKTDEERIQNLPYNELKQHTYIVTEKLDGSSWTAYVRDGEVGVCSRNLELLEDDKNSLWSIIRQYDLKEKLIALGRNIALQGELIGGKIQGNPYKLNGFDVRIFKMWDIDKSEYLTMEEMIALSAELGLTTVPILERGFRLPSTVDEALAYADKISTLFDTHREGVVLYAENDRRIHFKIISNKFLENEKL